MKSLVCRLLAAFVLLGGSAVVVRADEAPVQVPAEVLAASVAWSMPLPSDVSAKAAFEDAQRVLINRGWTILSRGDGLISATNKNKKVEGIAWIELKDGVISARSQAWRLDKTGARLRPRDIDGWMSNLEKDLRKALQLRQLDQASSTN